MNAVAIVNPFDDRRQPTVENRTTQTPLSRIEQRIVERLRLACLASSNVRRGGPCVTFFRW